MADTLLYAGYGANRDPAMIAHIIGQEPKALGRFAIVGFELCVQRLDQIPDVVAPDAPAPVSPFRIIEGTWGADSGFETYTIRPAENNSVEATVFEITPEQRALIAEWELIEFGWYKRQDVHVRFEDGRGLKANTEILGEGQTVDRVVDGLDYPTYLNDEARMHATADAARLEYLERQSSTE